MLPSQLEQRKSGRGARVEVAGVHSGAVEGDDHAGCFLWNRRLGKETGQDRVCDRQAELTDRRIGGRPALKAHHGCTVRLSNSPLSPWTITRTWSG